MPAIKQCETGREKFTENHAFIKARHNTKADTARQFGERVANAMRRGRLPVVLVDLTGEPRILREGRLSRDELAQAVPGLFGDDA